MLGILVLALLCVSLYISEEFTAVLVGNTIDGLAVITQPVLSPIVHREIVYRAAMKAYAAMKDQAGYQLQNAEQSDN